MFVFRNILRTHENGWSQMEATLTSFFLMNFWTEKISCFAIKVRNSKKIIIKKPGLKLKQTFLNRL